MYGNQAPQNAPMDSPSGGLHQSVTSLVGRIHESSLMLEKLRSRVLGPEPSAISGTSPKESREPSTVEFIEYAHQGMNRLEQQIQQLLSAIG